MEGGPMSDDGRPPRPSALEVEHEQIPDTLTDREQWVCWRYEWGSNRDEWTKVPVDVNTGGFASSTDPDTWASFASALAYHERDSKDTDGVGFVVHEEDTVAGLDLDDCRDPETGELEDWAEDVLDSVPTYAEASPSGTGLRLFGIGFTRDGKTRADIEGAEGHLELYDSKRYLTTTGQCVDSAETTVEQVNDEIDEIHGEYIAEEQPDESAQSAASDGGAATESPSAGKSADDLTDKQLIERAKNAKNGDKFTQLWNGNTGGYPSHSEADLALCGMLAFWTGGDKRWMADLFSQSGLYRDKWNRQDYRERTIEKALEGKSEFYDPDLHSSNDRPNQPKNEDREGGVSLTPVDVAIRAGLGEDDSILDLTDREKAACVWDLVRGTDDYYVRARRDNGSLWAYEDGVWNPNGERALRHAGRKALGSMNYGQNVLTELEAQVRGDPTVEIETDDLGLPAGHLAVENGLVDLQAVADGAGEEALRELEPDDYAMTQLPVAYDPDAEYDEWADYVEEWAEEGRADALQEYVGYCLHIGEIPIHRALLLVGSGANGKSTFLAVVRQLLGSDNTGSFELQTLANEKDALADFYGSLANIDDDLSARKIGQGIGMFKKLTAGNEVRGRKLYQEGFKYRATGKHLYAANQVPQVNVPDDDEAFWRRWLLVEFPQHYPPSERDPGLEDRLTEPEAMSGVLNWAIEGWARLLEQGHFSGEKRYAQAKRERWQAWGDSIDKFISECVERDESAANISTTDVHRVYAEWCRNNGERPGGQQNLTANLKNEDLDYGKSVRPGGTGTPTRGFKSLGFTDEAPDVDDTPERGSGQQQLG
jgi:putative DNA primase/helicase